MKNVSKRFGDVRANRGICFDVERGEVHTLLGENGAGKTTLMNILYGLHTPDEGEIYLNGRPVKIVSPHKAIELRIGMIHQHFMLIPNLSVAENIILGLPSRRGPLLMRKEAEEGIREISRKYALHVDPKALIGNLPVGAQQRVEILKALYRKIDLLILDEPTSVLTPLEVESLFNIIRKLTNDGLAVIFISHKLNEVMKISHRITVLKQGYLVGTKMTAETNANDLASMMVGRLMSLGVERPPARTGKELLQIRNVSVENRESNKPILKNVSLEVREGEVLGIAGVDGNGQNELAEIIAGLRPARQGRILIDGVDVTHSSPRQRINMKLAYIPSDRRRVGSILDLSVAENLILKTFKNAPFCVHGYLLNRQVMISKSKEMIRIFDIKAEQPTTKVSMLSGGNQQKVVLAREMTGEPLVLLAAQPTRGLDVGATKYVHQCILDHRDKGGATLLISTELDEILALSDRIAIIYEGEIMGILSGGEHANLEEISLMMAGAKRQGSRGPRS
jgi:simple sugar transport system ATP-binding protein